MVTARVNAPLYRQARGRGFDPPLLLGDGIANNRRIWQETPPHHECHAYLCHEIQNAQFRVLKRSQFYVPL